MYLNDGIYRDNQLKEMIHPNIGGTISYTGVSAGRKIRKGENWVAGEFYIPTAPYLMFSLPRCMEI